MYDLLAQNPSFPFPRPQAVPTDQISDRLGALRIPSVEEYLDALSNLHVLWAVLLVAFGLVYLLHGWKIFKLLVEINAAILGAMVGHTVASAVGVDDRAPIFAAIGGAVVFAVLAWPMMKYAISLMGGLAGSFVGYGVWTYVARLVGRPDLVNTYAWTGVLIGLITLGLLAFVIFRFVVMVFTSFQGSLMTVSGLICLLLKYDRVAAALTDALTENVHLMPLLVGIPAIVGIVAQHTAASKKGGKKKPEG